ncbi:MAG: 4Fe-4S binding protein [Thermoleophilia bacterium]|jgi:ferredoxin
MPLTKRGEAIFERLPTAAPQRSTGAIGCLIVRHEELCIGCGRCVDSCPSGACSRGTTFDPMQIFEAPEGTRRGALGAALRRIARRAPSGPIEVPERVTSFRTIGYDELVCLGCGTCARICPTQAAEALPLTAEKIHELMAAVAGKAAP